MSSHFPNNDDCFDRLVDGELSEPERRELLTSLDQEPDGWRRCALAFLEAQSWKEGIGALLRPAAARCATAGLSSSADGTVGQANRGVHTWKHFFRNYAGTALAVAASFLLAFGLANYWYGMQGDRSLGKGTDLVNVNSGGSQLPVTSGPSPLAPDSSSWQMVGLPATGDGNGAMIIPAAQRDRLDDQWMKNLPPAMPENVLRAFERTGHRVERQHNLVPMQMDDGRVLIVPVEQMEIQPTKRQVY
jgi:hypothetical protein